jgi:hypothetical protein
MQVTYMGKKKPNQISPERYCLAGRVLRRGPAVRGVISTLGDPNISRLRDLLYVLY